jgi:ketosteroid isomerase-like protein
MHGMTEVGGEKMHAANSAPEDVVKLRQMAHEFTEGFNTGDVDRIMRFYGDTYVDVNLRHPVQSNEERRAYYAQVMRRGGFHIDVQPDEILVQGDIAFVRGRIALTNVDAKSEGLAPTELRYLEIVRKQTDGSWKVMWGMDGPVQEYDPAK